MINVVNVRNGKKGTAEWMNESTWMVTLEGAEPKETSAANFKRWYRIEEDVEGAEQESAASQEAGENVRDVQEQEDQPQADETDEAAPATVEESGENPENAESQDEEAPQHPFEKLAEEQEAKLGPIGEGEVNVTNLADWVAKNYPEGEEPEQPTPAEGAGQDATTMSLLEGWVKSTGKSFKVFTRIQVSEGACLEITEYGGYITDVRVTDGTGKEIYKSPKMSVQDALMWAGFKQDDLKATKKQITDIRKHVKSSNPAE